MFRPFSTKKSPPPVGVIDPVGPDLGHPLLTARTLSMPTWVGTSKPYLPSPPDRDLRTKWENTKFKFEFIDPLGDRLPAGAPSQPETQEIHMTGKGVSKFDLEEIPFRISKGTLLARPAPPDNMDLRSMAFDEHKSSVYQSSRSNSNERDPKSSAHFCSPKRPPILEIDFRKTYKFTPRVTSSRRPRTQREQEYMSHYVGELKMSGSHRVVHVEGNFKVYNTDALTQALYGGSFSLNTILPSIQDIMKSMSTWTATIVGKHKNHKPVTIESSGIDLKFQSIQQWDKEHNQRRKNDPDLKSGDKPTLSSIAQLDSPPNLPADDNLTVHLTARLHGTVKNEKWDIRFSGFAGIDHEKKCYVKWLPGSSWPSGHKKMEAKMTTRKEDAPLCLYWRRVSWDLSSVSIALFRKDKYRDYHIELNGTSLRLHE